MIRCGFRPLDEVPAMQEHRFWFSLRKMLAIVTVLALFVAIIASSRHNHPDPNLPRFNDPHPGLNRLNAKLAQLKVGMTIAEVDTLMAGYLRRERRAELDYSGERRLPQPSPLTVKYYEKPVAPEGDFSLTAYFDEDGRLMDSSIGEVLN